MSIQVMNHDGDTLYLGEVPGVVVDNVDPLKLGRVRVRVEGLVEPESPWAFPKCGTGGGKAHRGSHDVPAKGATVVVSFLGGNIDVPIYGGAWRGKGEGLTALASASAEDAANKIKTFETDRYVITLREVSGSEEVLIQDKTNGNKISMKPDGTVLGSPSVKLGGDTATEQIPLGTTYRGAEDTMLSAFVTAINVAAPVCADAADPASAIAGVKAAGVCFAAMAAAIASFQTGAVGYLSQVSKTQ